VKVKFEFRRYLDAPEYASETTRLGKGISIPISSTSQVIGTEVGSSSGAAGRRIEMPEISLLQPTMPSAGPHQPCISPRTSPETCSTGSSTDLDGYELLERRGPRRAISQAIPSIPLPITNTPMITSARLGWISPINTAMTPMTMRARQQSYRTCWRHGPVAGCRGASPSGRLMRLTSWRLEVLEGVGKGDALR
jgi:hypothetical protein